MRRIFAIAAAFGALGAVPGVAALPPQYQRVIEMRAILDDDTVAASFGPARPVEKIERAGHDLYRLTGGSCSMDVTIEDDPKVVHPRGWSGRRSFVLKWQPLVCKQP